MDIIDFFNSDELEIPKTYDTSDFECFLNEQFSVYLNCLRSVAGSDPTSRELAKSVPVAETLCEAILQSLGFYLEGYPHTAFAALSTGLEAIEHPWLESLGSVPDISEAIQMLYRMRKSETLLSQRHDLFHVSYELRHVVATQRFSIPGLPSLYLGGSSWICWEELGRPDFNDMYISRFQPSTDSKISVLDLGWRPARLASLIHNEPRLLELESHTPFIVGNAVCWPLLFACSTRVRYPGWPFIPEYIIPQLLLQWIRLTQGFDGVRYFSTKVDQYVADPHAAANFVFPTKCRTSTGYCSQLVEKFELTEPAQVRLLKMSSHTAATPCPPNWRFELVKNKPTAYMATEFWDVERHLIGLPAERL